MNGQKILTGGNKACRKSFERLFWEEFGSFLKRQKGLLIVREAGVFSETLAAKEIIQNKKQSLIVSSPNIFKSIKSFL